MLALITNQDLTLEGLARDWPGNVRELRNVVERMRLLNASSRQSYDLSAFKGGPGGEEATVSAQPAATAQVLPGSQPRQQDEDIPTFLCQGKSARRRLERLRQFFRQFRELSHGEVRKISGASPTTVTHDLKALVDEGFLVRIEPTRSLRSRYYKLLESPKGDQPAT